MIDIILMKRQYLSNIWKSVSNRDKYPPSSKWRFSGNNNPWAPVKPGMSVQMECPENLGHLGIILESIEKGNTVSCFQIR